MSRSLLSDVASKDIPDAVGRLLVIPIGALEAHGPHLPLGADLLQAEATARELAEQYPCFVAPGVPYGVCPGSRVFPGTVSLQPSTLARLLADIGEEFYRMGFRRFLVVSGHGAAAHMAALRDGIGDVVRRHPEAKAAVLCDYEFVYELRGKVAPSTDGHAGLLETSRVMALSPDLVGTERPVVDYRVHRFSVGDPTREEWSESVIGDTHGASADIGQKIQAHVRKRLLESVQAIFGGS